MFLTETPLRALPQPRGFSLAPVFTTLAGLIDRLPRPLTREARERAYLEDSSSLYDLECREREIDRGKFAGY